MAHFLKVLLGAAKDNDVDMLQTLLDDGVEVGFFCQCVQFHVTRAAASGETVSV
jgi:hypothetical protein